MNLHNVNDLACDVNLFAYYGHNLIDKTLQAAELTLK